MRCIALSIGLLLVLVLLAAASGTVSGPAVGSTSVDQVDELDIEVFARADCPACQRAEAYLDELQQQRPGLRIRVSDVVANPSALARLRSLADAHNLSAVATPTFVVRGRILVGWVDRDTTGRQIEALLDGSTVQTASDSIETCSLESTCNLSESIRNSVSLPVVGRVEAGSLGLPAFTAVVGLLDGFNPCAMWVLVFILSLLASSHNRPTMLLIAGTFVFVSGLIYFAFMAAWLNVFLLVGLTREVQLVLGSVALVAGAINAKDFVAFGRGPSLSIPSQVKPGIYSRVNRVVRAERVWLALIGVATLAVMVNGVELLCTAGLPAIYTQVLASQQLATWQYYAYLAGYQVFYMLDDTVMLGIAVITLSRHRLQEREGRWLKLLSGAVMLVLGALLLFQPAWLQWTL